MSRQARSCTGCGVRRNDGRRALCDDCAGAAGRLRSIFSSQAVGMTPAEREARLAEGRNTYLRLKAEIERRTGKAVEV